MTVSPHYEKVRSIKLTSLGSDKDAVPDNNSKGSLETDKDAKELTPDKDSAGWKSDAHKNLPGFRTLYETFPKAKWYIMIDDDTYILKHNLAATLRRYDHTKNHYFGNPNLFVGCDGMKIYLAN